MLGTTGVEGGRNKNLAVAQSTLETVRSVGGKGVKPTFNVILAELRLRNVLSNHRSLRCYLDLLVKSGVLRVRTEEADHPNLRPRQVYSLTGRGPFLEVGEKALLFHGLNWVVPSRFSLKVKSDLEGLVRARVDGRAVYGSLEDTVVGYLVGTKSTPRVHQAFVFCAALLAVARVDREYLTRRARANGVESLVRGLLGEIDYLLFSARPGVEDVRTLFEVRRRLAHRVPMRRPIQSQHPMSPDEMLEVLGKQLGVR
jgi:hypothetical protein